MGIEAILAGINAITENKIAELQQQTVQQVNQILFRSKEEVEEIRKNLEKEGRVRLNREAAIIQQQAEMQYLQNISDARQKLIQESLGQIEIALRSIRTQGEYPALLRSLIKEAVGDLQPSLGQEKEIIVSVDPKDKELLNKFPKDGSVKIHFQYDLDCWGGCNASSLDGKVCVYNTLNDRFQKAVPILQQWLSLFFSEQVTGMD
ncbi:MAG TPA: V-type ATP synthase subunit E [Anaerolineaceae bacterium]|nr:V-type ATP synthase subunit E [Anaerolineaceae bacterium]